MPANLRLLQRLRTHRSLLITLAGLVLVPLIYSSFLILGNQDPTHNLSKVPAIVVNQDKVATIKGADGKQTQVLLGRSVVSALTKNDSSQNFNWSVDNAADAKQKLQRGDALAVLTIPSDFSKNATSTAGSNPSAAAASTLTITTNDATNFITGSISTSIVKQVAKNTSDTLLQGYLSNVYVGFTTLHSQLQTAASGAQQLADGSKDLSSGTSQLASGTRSSAAGARQLASGTQGVASGSASLASGAADVNSGAQALAKGTSQLRSSTQSLPAQTRQLASGAKAVASGAKSLDGGVQQSASGAEQLAAGSDQLRDGVREYTGAVSGLAQQCAASGASEQFCQQLTGVAESGQSLNAGASQSASGAAALAKGLDEAAGGSKQLVSGSGELAAGTSELAAGTKSLSSGIKNLDSGAHQVAFGTSSLNEGAATLSSGAAKVAGGTKDLAGGLNTLASGASTLSGGAKDLNSGASSLSDGLEKGVTSIPSYTAGERQHLAQVAAEPVQPKAVVLNATPAYGYNLAPYFLALALWVGGLATYMILLPLRKRSAGRSTLLNTLLSFAPGAAIAAVQSLVMVSVVHFGLGIQMSSTWGLLGLSLLGGLAFMALNQAFIALFGPRGRFAALILLVLQLAAAGATYPIQTTPGFFQFLHNLLPISYTVQGLRSLIAGGGLGIGSAVIALVVTLLVGLSLTYLALRRRDRAQWVAAAA